MSIDFWVYLIAIVGIVIVVALLFIISTFWKMSNYYLDRVESHDKILNRIRDDINSIRALATVIQSAKSMLNEAENRQIQGDLESLDLTPHPKEKREPSKGAVAKLESAARKLMAGAGAKSGRDGG